MVEGGPLSQEEFKAWSNDVVLFCHITSQVETDSHQNLLSEKGGQGFPHFAIMNASGDVLKIHQGSRDVAGFTASVNEAAQTNAKLKELTAKAKTDKAAAKELFFLKLELGHLGYEAAKKQAGELTLTDDEKAGLKGQLASLRVNDILSKIETRDDFMKIATPKFVEMANNGEIPSNEALLQPFWISQMDWAEQEKDVKVFKRALEALEAAFGDNPRAKRFFDRRREVLESLEGGDGEDAREEIEEVEEEVDRDR